MYGWDTLVLLKHLLEEGLSKTAIAARLGVSRRLIYHLIDTGQLDRDLAEPPPRRTRTAPPTKLELYKAIITTRLATYPELVVIDPGCAFTLKVVYPRVGVELTTQVRTVYEVLAERLEHASDKAPLPERVAYHDACHLGRGLGQYEEPRALLKRAVRELREAHDNCAEAGCSGGGGLLPRTMAETSVQIARRQAERLTSEDETIVTACPTSRRMFERAGRKADDLLSVLRRWLRQETSE